ncbi:hypothetical protein HanRHA438_Chr06g0286611 [Helianthus annuus]|nr:hypothetical protein HanHA300_Chr06g0227651 [Helianthus annuus]KAJ0574909.1 hypothetical protein HanHA89_Chr06g0243591 [Helianthus annuus]KAJ0739239.1 hypothetical protein HanLR1_Chr06g0227641 [Helianthus annuus]KAJ0913526.1 hypothetical protein HanRHA438_Chr06g0286611 [Helianthus annuus]
MMMMILSMLSVFVVVNNQMMMHPPMASPLPLPSVAPSSNFKQATCGFARQFRSSAISTMRTSTRLSAGDFIIKEEEEEEENDVLLLTFLKDRELNGDFIAKVSDKLWMMRTNTINIHNTQLTNNNNNANQLHDEPFVDENTGGFLKLTTTNDWLLGQNTAPINKKMRAKQQRDDSQRRTRLNLLQYEAVKRELLYLTVGIGSACSVYCLITFSIQAAVSYATGVLFSCLYLQLLYRYVDNISRGEVPQIFRQKKIKKIGIRSGDLEETFERVVKGCSMALSSPRLVIPAAIYGLWGLSQHFANDYFQLTPAMVGVFAYKAAALVQVYRDNEDLQLILPGNEEDQDLQ